MAKQRVQTGGTPAIQTKVDTPAEKSPEAAHSARRSAHRWRPPWALIVAFLGLLIAGVLLGATRERRAEVAAWTAVNDCDARALPVEDGLSDYFGLVQFLQQRSEVSAYLSLCESKPKLALKVFRETMDRGSPGGKLLAMYSTLYLTVRKQLEDSDFQRIVAQLAPSPSPAHEAAASAPPSPASGKDKDTDLRKVAQRVISELTVIDDSTNPSRYEVVPAGLPLPAKDPNDKEGEPKPNKVQTKEEKLRDSGKAVLSVRWSSPDVAYKWWETMAAKGHWDNGLQRFVIQP